jgi:hypothetical protein
MGDEARFVADTFHLGESLAGRSGEVPTTFFHMVK